MVEYGKETEVRKKIEQFQSTGALYRHPFPEFYYTEGVKYALKELFRRQGLLSDIAREIFHLPENNFVLIKICASHVEFSNRNGNVLQVKETKNSIPLIPGTSLCLYWIGRTLLLPTEY
ncbi:hypothetical protein LS482_19270 [Sinomicrobium kalidii]|uniref:DUF6876 family protein n=1 Tax=Sinomicrobium kalidii TaxID=2900738 RepID=UPI001E52D7E3|nr:DUF6876 family protein [Sinomicrobium kalidii]UGU15808.1 hypothetical protein LS482_19270 [Sinomicrobium kalidii]